MGQTAYSIAMKEMGDLIAKANLGNKALEEVNAQLADIAINPRLFGAKFDGTTDDTIAIQAAIDSLVNGGTVQIPGKARITTINLKTGVFLDGIGQEKSGFISSSATIINIPNLTVRWGIYNLGVWGSVSTSVGINLDGNTGGIADFSIRDVYVKDCLTGFKSVFAWAFTVDRVRFQDCKDGLILNSQTNQGSFTNCSIKVNSRAIAFTNCNAINFIGNEFAGTVSHDGTVPIYLFQSQALEFTGNYVELFTPNTALMLIGTNSSVVNRGISIRTNYISHTTTGELFTVYGCNGLDISNNRIGTVGYLVNDMSGNIKGLNLKGNDGYIYESKMENLIPNYNFFSWPSGTSNFPANFSPVSSTASRGSDGSLEVVTAVGVQGFFTTLDEYNLGYITFEIDVKSSVDNIVFIDEFINGAYGALKQITVTAGVYKKVSFVVYVNAATLTFFRVRFSVAGTHNVKSIRAYRGVIEAEADKEIRLLCSNAPTHNTFMKGDVITNTNPVVGGIKEWICTAAGTPGTHTPIQLGALTSIAATPQSVGFFAVSGGLGYMATGTASTADWKQITN